DFFQCLFYYFYYFFFFFFQAEDGIRDKLVTGVQTCALPIFGGHGLAALQLNALAPRVPGPVPAHRAGDTCCTRAPGTASPRWRRSEERRVGKECRARWGRERRKKRKRKRKARTCRETSVMCE